MKSKIINNIQEALELFVLSITDNINYGSEGNSKKANKAYDNWEKSVGYLLLNDKINLLEQFYLSDNAYAMLGAAVMLAPIDEKNAKKVLQKLYKMDIYRISFNAEWCLKCFDDISNKKKYDRIIESYKKKSTISRY